MQYSRLRVLGGGQIGRIFVQSALMKGFPRESIALAVEYPAADRKVYGVPTEYSHDVLFDSAAEDIVALAVKPTQLPNLLNNIRDQLHPDSTVISAIPTFSQRYLEKNLPTQRILRVMPSILNEHGLGRLIAYRSKATGMDRQIIGSLFDPHLIRWVKDEDILELMTILNGCLPGWFAKLSESVFDYSRKIGISEELSRDVIGKALCGTGLYLTQLSPKQLQQRVATPGGITEAGLQTLSDAGVLDDLNKSLRTMTARLLYNQKK